MAPRASLRWPRRILIILGFLLIGVWFKFDSEARALRSAEAKKLEAARTGGGLSGAPPFRLAEGPWCPTALESGVFGRIEIPRIGISVLIAEGVEPAQLDRTVGHITTTVFPGRSGNCALVGHRDSFLSGLGDVRENDVIRIDTLQGTYTYVVEWGRVAGQRRVDVLAATAVPSLTLMACDPISAVDPASDHFVVRARLVEPTASIAR